MASMSSLILYHGSPCIVEHPSYGKGKPYNDYGRGFYCTESAELAKEWACAEMSDGYANRYEMALDGLDVLNLLEDGYTVLNWLAILLENRISRMGTPLEKRGRTYIIENFLPDYRGADAIIGYRADDSYFSFTRAFLGNSISLEQLEHAMRLGKLGQQFVLKSKKAFEAIRYLDCAVAECNVYFARRKARDERARSDFQMELEHDDLNGIFLRDIVQERMGPDDRRLQRSLS